MKLDDNEIERDAFLEAADELMSTAQSLSVATMNNATERAEMVINAINDFRKQLIYYERSLLRKGQK